MAVLEKRRKDETTAEPDTQQPVFRGRDAGCIACRQPIAAHFDQQGHWLGCRVPNLPPDVPFLLLPDRRVFRDRRVSPVTGDGNGRKETILEVLQEGLENTTEPQLAPVSQKPNSGSFVAGPRTIYRVAPKVTPALLELLAPHERRIFDLVAARPNGATREQLLNELGTRSTGRIDGPLRELRLRRYIRAVPIKAKV